MQLEDLSVVNRKYAINMKADLTCPDMNAAIMYNDTKTNIKGIRAILKTEEDFLLLDDSMLRMAHYIAYVNRDRKSLDQIDRLNSLTDTEKEAHVKNYLNSEYLRRNMIFDFETYQELLDLDASLLNESDESYLLESPYILYSISYLQTIFYEYYETNKKAHAYINDVLTSLAHESINNIDNLIAIESTREEFNHKNKAKIITFKKNLK